MADYATSTTEREAPPAVQFAREEIDASIVVEQVRAILSMVTITADESGGYDQMHVTQSLISKVVDGANSLLGFVQAHLEAAEAQTAPGTRH